jgi:hypothetical protein
METILKCVRCRRVISTEHEIVACTCDHCADKAHRPPILTMRSTPKRTTKPFNKRMRPVA